jgi:hypothetical protein
MTHGSGKNNYGDTAPPFRRFSSGRLSRRLLAEYSSDPFRLHSRHRARGLDHCQTLSKAVHSRKEMEKKEK